MTPELARLFFPKLLHWHVKTAMTNVLMMQAAMVAPITMYRDTLKAVLR